MIALTSSRGAPGVTTTALALTLVWPRPVVLVEADVSGSSSVGAGYLRGSIDPRRGLINLAVEHRRGTLSADGVREQAVPLTDGENGLLVPGLSSADQVGSMTPDLWVSLADALAAFDDAGTDVIVDAGRLGALGGPDPLLRQADTVLLVMRTSLDAVASARARVGQLRDLVGSAAVFEGTGVDGATRLNGTGVTGARVARGLGGADGLGLVLVGEGRPYRAVEVAKAVGLPVVATVSYDEPNAQVLSHGTPRGRRFDSSPLVRSARSAADQIQHVTAALDAHLVPPVTTPDGAEEVPSDEPA